MIKLNEKSGIPIFESDMIPAPHGFTTRLGGVSDSKEYKSLNLGVRTDDSFQNVSENYRRIKMIFDTEKMILAKQEHTDKVISVGADDFGKGEIGEEPFPFGVDGLVTDVKGAVLGVFTADCTPVLLHDPIKGVIGAVHSGWRGTKAKITGKTVALMQEKYGCNPSDIVAAIGPSIKKCCFEIGEDVADMLKNAYPEVGFIQKHGEKYLADTDICITHDLNTMGVTKIDVCKTCTFCQNDIMFSHRKGDKARQLGIIKNM